MKEVDSITRKNEDKKLVWRLGERPSVENITKLNEIGLISKEEARELMFNEISHNDVKTINDISEELKVIRELVMRLSQNDGTITNWFSTNTGTISNDWIKPYRSFFRIM